MGVNSPKKYPLWGYLALKKYPLWGYFVRRMSRRLEKNTPYGGGWAEKYDKKDKKYQKIAQKSKKYLKKELVELKIDA